MSWRVRLACMAAMVLALACFAAGTSLAEPMTEETLIQAWERAVLADPETLVLEPLGDNRYHFATDRFPYDGELVILNTSIEPSIGSFDYPMGIVELKFTDADDAFREDYGDTYGLWTQNNKYLYYDQDGEQWLTTRELSDLELSDYDPPWYSYLAGGDLVWVLFLVLLIVFLAIGIRKSTRQMKAAMAAQERALADNREMLELARNNLVLQQEALDVLKTIRDKSST